MSEEFEDFGFTLVSEDELDSTQELQTTATTLVEAQERLTKLYNAIQPLLNNLKANPEKEFIKWPDRAEKVQRFSDHIDDIYYGK